MFLYLSSTYKDLIVQKRDAHHYNTPHGLEITYPLPTHLAHFTSTMQSQHYYSHHSIEVKILDGLKLSI